MPFTIITTTTNSRRDVQQAIDWENMRKPGLAAYFLDDLEKNWNIYLLLRVQAVSVTKTSILPTPRYSLITFIILLMTNYNKL